jgi:hypothetical protein
VTISVYTTPNSPTKPWDLKHKMNNISPDRVVTIEEAMIEFGEPDIHTIIAVRISGHYLNPE